MKGFTLIELLIAVAIIGILSAVAVPIYRDYIRVATEKTAQDGLHTIYVAQLEYFSDNNAYYSTGAACADATAAINTNLFNGTNVLDGTDFTYCILQTATSDFTAQANEVGGTTQFTIDETRAVNF